MKTFFAYVLKCVYSVFAGSWTAGTRYDTPLPFPIPKADNGAVGFVTEGHKLVDLNFAIPSFRNGIDEHLFDLALEEDKILTLKWLLSIIMGQNHNWF